MSERDEVMAQARAIAAEVEAAVFSKTPELVQVSGNWYRIDSLDAAWAEAEAALPEGWKIAELVRGADSWEGANGAWQAVAWGQSAKVFGLGVTPIAALGALTAKLREAR